MCKKSLRSYNYIPVEMQAYLRNYGYSFSKRACEYAVSLMEKVDPKTGETEPLQPWDKAKVEELLHKHKIELQNNMNYNHVYVANMILADRWGSSVEDEKHLALAIKDEIDDVDAAADSIFNCWMVKLEDKGISVPWEEMI